MPEFSVNIYGENREKMNEFEKEIKDMYASINSETTARDEIAKFIEITRLKFHLILRELDGERRVFLQGIMEGLNLALEIVKNRSKQKKDRKEISGDLSSHRY